MAVKELAVVENCIVMEKVRHPRLLMKLFHSIINRFDLSQHVAQTSHNISPKWDPSSQESRDEHLDSLSLHLLHHTQLLSTTHMHTHSLSSSFFYYLSQSPSLSQLQSHSLPVSLNCRQTCTLTSIAHIWRLSLTLSHSLVLSPSYITTTHATQIHPHTH